MPVRLFPSQSAAVEPPNPPDPNSHRQAFVLRQQTAPEPDPWVELRDLNDQRAPSTSQETQPLLGKKKRSSFPLGDPKVWQLKNRKLDNVCPRSVSWSLAEPNPRDPVKQRQSFNDAENLNNNNFDNFEQSSTEIYRKPTGSYKLATKFHRPPSFRLGASPNPSSLAPPRSPFLVPNGGPTRPTLSPLISPEPPLWTPSSRHPSAVPFGPPFASPFSLFGGGIGRRHYFGAPYQPIQRFPRRQSVAPSIYQPESEPRYADVRPFGRRRTLASLALAKFKTRINSKSVDSISDLQKSLDSLDSKKKESLAKRESAGDWRIRETEKQEDFVDKFEGPLQKDFEKSLGEKDFEKCLAGNTSEASQRSSHFEQPTDRLDPFYQLTNKLDPFEKSTGNKEPFEKLTGIKNPFKGSTNTLAPVSSLRPRFLPHQRKSLQFVDAPIIREPLQYSAYNYPQETLQTLNLPVLQPVGTTPHSNPTVVLPSQYTNPALPLPNTYSGSTVGLQNPILKPTVPSEHQNPYNQPKTSEATDSTVKLQKADSKEKSKYLTKFERPVYNRSISGYSSRLPYSGSITARIRPVSRMWTAEDESDGEGSQPSFDLDKNDNEAY
ncbi:unnamed protein product [Bursaphelenchus okinawaensis]|uniref:Uncharacterized protein n=1 Tax=Bursaphelenchus okinawaensis TaxID=465554 RepID=A0A811KG82_9BILA|nr:unnamed protein product [Bursaphelenchus okinawaensis]CAG9102602.1 unnamed protein product [Bursaphelenchus okinawaensis]